MSNEAMKVFQDTADDLAERKRKLESMGYTFDCGYWVDTNGNALCVGVVCRCDERVFCPMHGKAK